MACPPVNIPQNHYNKIMEKPNRKHPDTGRPITEGQYQQWKRDAKDAATPRTGESPSMKFPSISSDKDELSGGVNLPVSRDLPFKSPRIASRKKRR